MTLALAKSLRRGTDWLDSRSVRERVMLLVAVLTVAVTAWTVLLIDPLSELRGEASSEASRIEQQLRQLEARGQAVLEAHARDGNAELRKRAEALRQQIAGVDAKIHQHTVTMISPPEMAYFLEEILAKDANLKLERLENAGAEPLLDRSGTEKAGEGEEEAEATFTGVYKHSFEVVFRGRYLDALRYLRALEALPWNFFWDSFEYEVLDYPDGRATIRAYTLSSGEDWVGV